MTSRPTNLLLSAFALLGSVPAAAADDGMTMFLRNGAGRPVVVEFHGRASGTVWPGKGQVYLLEKDERKSVTLGCSQGEQICYGGWAMGDDRISFGVGPDDNRACEDCCRICVSGTTETIDIGGGR